MLTADDRSHLKTLSICWYVYAALNAIGILCGGGVCLMGCVMAAENEAGFFLGGMGLFAMLISGVITLVTYLAGQSLMQRRNLILIYIVSGIACLNVPLGTILGVFTFIVLARPQVKEAFTNPATATRPPATMPQ